MNNKNTMGVIAIIVLLFMGALFGGYIEKRIIQKNAINAGVGQYNSLTGEFEWVTSHPNSP